jgi:hypothetical protein
MFTLSDGVDEVERIAQVRFQFFSGRAQYVATLIFTVAEMTAAWGSEPPTIYVTAQLINDTAGPGNTLEFEV